MKYSNGHSLNWLETQQTVIDDEMRLFDLINGYRASRGRAALHYDQALSRCARAHGRHHFEHAGFMGHDNPEGDDFAERMTKNGVAYTTSGENINYGASTPEEAFQGWLDSDPHRLNMEHECFTRVGVGLHGNVWTANFAR